MLLGTHQHSERERYNFNSGFSQNSAGHAEVNSITRVLEQPRTASEEAYALIGHDKARPNPAMVMKKEISRSGSRECFIDDANAVTEESKKAVLKVEKKTEEPTKRGWGRRMLQWFYFHRPRR